MSTKDIHTFIYNSPARKRSIVATIVLQEDGALTVDFFTIVSFKTKEHATYPVGSEKEALELCASLIKPYEAKNYDLSNGHYSPRKALADIATAEAAAACTPVVHVVISVVVDPIAGVYTNGGAMVPAFF